MLDLQPGMSARSLALRILLQVSAAALVTGCAITIKAPANRFDSPEANGRAGSGHIDPVGFEGSSMLVITPDDTIVPPDLSTKALQPSTWDYRLAGGVGITDRLDIDLKIPGDSGVTILELKYQLLGDTQITGHQGNVSFAVSLGGGFGTHTHSDSFSGFGETVTSKGSLSYGAWDVAAIGGYRLADILLVYGGPFFTHIGYNGSFDQVSTGTVHYTYNGILNSSGGNIGLQIGIKPVSFQAEFAVATADNGAGGKLTSQYGGLNLSVHW